MDDGPKGQKLVSMAQMCYTIEGTIKCSKHPHLTYCYILTRPGIATRLCLTFCEDFVLWNSAILSQ
jgi:hypothetical protein